MNEGAPGRPSAYDKYDVDHRAKVATGQEVRERVEREYERFGPFAGYLAHLLGRGQVDDLLDAQAAQLKGQVTTRTAPPDPGADYLGISHRELHDGVHVGGDPGRVGEHGDLWTALGNELVEFNDAIVKAIADSEPDWTGEAGDRARHAMADLARKAGETAVAAQMAGTLFAQQSRALSTARATVPPPPAEPFDVEAANRRLMTITDPVALATRAAADRAEFAKQQEEHRQAARAVEVYDRTVAQTAAAQPSFAPPPAAPPTPPRGEPSPARPPGQVPGDRAAVPPPPRVGDGTVVASAEPGGRHRGAHRRDDHHQRQRFGPGHPGWPGRCAGRARSRRSGGGGRAGRSRGWIGRGTRRVGCGTRRGRVGCGTGGARRRVRRQRGRRGARSRWRGAGVGVAGRAGIGGEGRSAGRCARGGRRAARRCGAGLGRWSGGRAGRRPGRGGRRAPVAVLPARTRPRSPVRRRRGDGSAGDRRLVRPGLTAASRRFPGPRSGSAPRRCATVGGTTCRCRL
ncbi:hypothetical protein IOD16_31275 [Saccharothrix sp. 6-C]|uniref:hypothetical protein n=1 Tax=Saccharothrix sp. 6-C TaxID=2781735 RepID=UPI00191716E7|nr:hypothetical protein [Saccharothrix sp. 6-C]QQQ75532.1 hypothetical protein IOD16_31275 [Saccharothrix sp. 6-C]